MKQYEKHIINVEKGMSEAANAAKSKVGGITGSSAEKTE